VSISASDAYLSILTSNAVIGSNIRYIWGVVLGGPCPLDFYELIKLLVLTNFRTAEMAAQSALSLIIVIFKEHTYSEKKTYSKTLRVGWYFSYDHDSIDSRRYIHFDYFKDVKYND